MPGACLILERAPFGAATCSSKPAIRQSPPEALPRAVDSITAARHWARLASGEVAEWLKAADCKSARVSRTLVRIQPSPPRLRVGRGLPQRLLVNIPFNEECCIVRYTSVSTRSFHRFDLV